MMQSSKEDRQYNIADGSPVFHSLAIIEERIREKLTVEGLADSVHFSRYHYQRMFREAVGDSVMGYVTRRRISLAAMELAESDASVLEIALKYGYDSHEGFTRSFRSHMGVTPMEYRKYHLPANHFKVQEERVMIYSKTMDEIIRELNAWTVQARETAAYTRKQMGTDTGAVRFYSRFWNMIAGKTEAMADKLLQNVSRVAAVACRPDEISARFLIMDVIGETAFQSDLIAFQAGLTMARANPEHREAFQPLCNKYESLASGARARSGRLGEFMRELWLLISRELQKDAGRKIGRAVDKGTEAVRDLSADPAFPYRYITEEVRAITEELSAMPLEEVTVDCLENNLMRLDMIAFAADVDALRAPEHRPVLEKISDFRQKWRMQSNFSVICLGIYSIVLWNQRKGQRKVMLQRLPCGGVTENRNCGEICCCFISGGKSRSWAMRT